MRTYATAKIHGLKVTRAELHYEGSITLPAGLLGWAGIGLLELVHVNGYASGKHWQTYVIAGAYGEVCLNGPPARLFSVGEELVVVRYELAVDPPEGIQVVRVGEGNELESSSFKPRGADR